MLFGESIYKTMTQESAAPHVMASPPSGFLKRSAFIPIKHTNTHCAECWLCVAVTCNLHSGSCRSVLFLYEFRKREREREMRRRRVNEAVCHLGSAALNTVSMVTSLSHAIKSRNEIRPRPPPSASTRLKLLSAKPRPQLFVSTPSIP